MLGEKEHFNYYELLGIRESASLEEIKSAYRNLVRQYHTDGLNIPPEREKLKKDIEDKLKLINEAYAILSDSEKRRRYDSEFKRNRADQHGKVDEKIHESPPQSSSSHSKPRQQRWSIFLLVGLGILGIIWISSLISKLDNGSKVGLPEGMVLVPAGDFIMGTDETDPEDKAAEYGIMKPWLVDESPAHKVFLDAYYINKYEVSNLEYKKFVDATGHRPPPYWQEGRYPEGDDKLPAVMVTWDDANSFCLWAGKRLPTEAEWEKGARGTDGRRFPWGNEFDNTKANVGATRSGPMPVTDFESGKSLYGAYQMIGNVWEWTSDWYKPYPGNKYSTDQYGEKFRVLRGNSFANVGHFHQEIHREVVARHSSATFRLFFRQDGSVGDIGFRCAKSIKK